MRSDTVLIQQASGDYQALLALTVQRHLAYCLSHDIDYWPIFGEMRSESYDDFERPPHYDRVALLRTALEAGYNGVIWLDADCIILGSDDMRQGIPENGIGASWCEKESWDNPKLYNHFCTGALYLRNNVHVVNFLEEWWFEPHDGHGWYDQHAFNNLLKPKRFNDNHVHPISRHWHSILPDFLPDDESVPQVVAFHGYGNLEQRLTAMEAIFTGEAQNGVL